GERGVGGLGGGVAGGSGRGAGVPIIKILLEPIAAKSPGPPIPHPLSMAQLEVPPAVVHAVLWQPPISTRLRLGGQYVECRKRGRTEPAKVGHVGRLPP